MEEKLNKRFRWTFPKAEAVDQRTIKDSVLLDPKEKTMALRFCALLRYINSIQVNEYWYFLSRIE